MYISVQYSGRFKCGRTRSDSSVAPWRPRRARVPVPRRPGLSSLLNRFCALLRSEMPPVTVRKISNHFTRGSSVPPELRNRRLNIRDREERLARERERERGGGSRQRRRQRGQRRGPAAVTRARGGGGTSLAHSFACLQSNSVASRASVHCCAKPPCQRL